MKSVEAQVNARLSCPIDVQVVQEKDRVVAECLQDVLRGSSFRLERVKVQEPDCTPASAKVVGLIALISSNYSESAKREFEEIVKYAREKAQWELERAPCLELHMPPLPKTVQNPSISQ